MILILELGRNSDSYEVIATQFPRNERQDWKAAGQMVDSRWEVEGRSFNVLLNGDGYEVADATISNLTWEMASRRGNVDVAGKLGSVVVQVPEFNSS